MIVSLFSTNQFPKTLKFGFLPSKATYFIGFGIKKTKAKLKIKFLNFLNHALSTPSILS